MQEIKIGRSSSNDLVINEKLVSRLHASIFISGADMFVVDHRSTNGTFINGIKVVGQKKLTRVDILKVGNRPVPWMNYVNKENVDQEYAPTNISIEKPVPVYLPYPAQKSSGGTPVLAIVIILLVFLAAAIMFLTNSEPARWVRYTLLPPYPSVVAGSKQDSGIPELFGDYKHKVTAKIINDGSDGYVQITTIVKDCEGKRFERRTRVFIRSGETYNYEAIVEEVNFFDGCGMATSEITTRATY
jgi:hypothetical protein